MHETNTKKAIDRIHFGIENIVAIQTSRLSPDINCQSRSPFDSFNLALHVDDDYQQVLKNRAMLSECFNSQTQIQWLEQVHGNKVITINSVSDKPFVADAMVTRQKNIALAIMTADCLPILICDKFGKEIAAIHAGWRPLAANIIAHTLNELTSPTSDLQAWFGPCIGQTAFEIGDEVREAFLTIDAELVVCFKKYQQRWHADLTLIAQHLLQKQGVTNIHILDECTFQQTDKYFSYRRNSRTGRMVSVIAINR
ncbi:peptidoglycan editing factor PgeF [Thalassotalea sp. 1_MG-2023]|uniref:peptidoglycan editing factor PgeF n=1 Tax=Thalassotalea sp. 1_MG-2023 TaxID=3062680 RepID=UPI0026E3F112|nr:peptidoglycan editing factor PgeF [Thalassotalea sp. 1_MG-2023]MDO6427811.1 peptidoglycan editing factor PgeF [Thalassotalea sp. 1_MG-2023]